MQLIIIISPVIFSFTFSLHSWSKLHIASLMIWSTLKMNNSMFLFNALDFFCFFPFVVTWICAVCSVQKDNGDEHSQFRQSKSFRTFQRNISTKHNKSVISSLLVVLRCVFVFESKSYRFGRTWGWENEDRAFIFSWTINLNEYFLNEYHNFWTHIHAHILTNWSQKEPRAQYSSQHAWYFICIWFMM